MLLDEQGRLTVTWPRAGWLLRSAKAWRPLPADAHSETLVSGDALLLRADVAHALHNPGATPTDLLLFVDVPATLLTPQPLPASNRQALADFVHLVDPQWTGQTRQIAPGVSANVLVSAADGGADNACPRALTVIPIA